MTINKTDSFLSYSMKNPLHAWTGVSKEFELKINYTPDNKEITATEMTAKVASFDSQIPMRDKDAVKLLEASKFPNVSFKSTDIVSIKEQLEVIGELSFHGVNRMLSFIVKKEIIENQLKITGGFSIKLTDFNLKPPGSFLLKTEDNIDLKFVFFASLHNF